MAEYCHPVVVGPTVWRENRHLICSTRENGVLTAVLDYGRAKCLKTTNHNYLWKTPFRGYNSLRTFFVQVENSTSEPLLRDTATVGLIDGSGRRLIWQKKKLF